MQVVPRRTAAPAPAPYAAAEASFAETKAYLSSREALQMRESDLERELNRRGQELMRKLLQGHLDQRSPGEAAGPVEGSDGVERSERRLHDRQLETTFGTVSVARLGYAHPGHESLHPLDASLNLPAERYSLEVRRRVAEAAASRSFDETLFELSRHSGADVPKRQAEQLVARAAEDFDAFYEDRRAAAGEPVADESVVVLTFDGKGVVLHHEDLREATRKAAERRLINDNYFCRLPRTRSPVRGPTQSRVRLPVFLVEDGLVTDAQVRRLREKRMSGKTLAAAAAAAGMSERTARQWQSGALPSTAKGPRTWRTREDPFAEVWESEVVPQLAADTDGRLQVLTLFKALCRRHPGRFQEGQLRTLQRRVRDWRVQYGADREVYFEQVAVPGREAAFDFTDASDLRVTIRGVPFAHLLFEWVLSYSKWTYVGLALSETFEALVAGLQGALWMLGAVPAVLRHDNLSAATHELKRSGGRQLTARFRQVLDHYGLDSSRIQPGKPHENGVAEQAHFRTKTAIEQALLLRGDRDFADESAYLGFVRAVVDEERNRPAAARLAEERLSLRPLPAARIPEYTTFQCRVRKWSTIRIGSRIYSVPSRLIGHTVEARQHPSTVEVLYGGRVLCTMPRLRGSADHRIEYRHIIGSLVRKPGAFARYRFREELFPSLTFRSAYDALGRTHGERADVEYVRLLHLAATTSERQVEATLRARLDAGVACDYASVQAEVSPPVPTIPVVNIPRPDLTRYDALLTGGLQG